MVYAIIGVSILFILIAFLVTENNAKYLLAGFNSMSEEEKKKVDLNGFLSYFRKFQIFLGISLLIIGLGLLYFGNEKVSGIFLAVYPMLAYLYFISSSPKFTRS